MLKDEFRSDIPIHRIHTPLCFLMFLCCNSPEAKDIGKKNTSWSLCENPMTEVPRHLWWSWWSRGTWGTWSSFSYRIHFEIFSMKSTHRQHVSHSELGVPTWRLSTTFLTFLSWKFVGVRNVPKKNSRKSEVENPFDQIFEPPGNIPLRKEGNFVMVGLGSRKLISKRTEQTQQTSTNTMSDALTELFAWPLKGSKVYLPNISESQR